MSSELQRIPTILVFNDNDGTLFKTEQFINDTKRALSDSRAQELDRDIRERRELMGTSALTKLVEIIGDELATVNEKVPQQHYVYEDVERHIQRKRCGGFILKHVMLTHTIEENVEHKTTGTILSDMPIVVRETNDKMDYIYSRMDEQGRYHHEGFSADWCFLIDDNASSFKDGKGGFQMVEQLPNFIGFNIVRKDEYDHNKGLEMPPSIIRISTLDRIPGYIENLSVDYNSKLY